MKKNQGIIITILMICIFSNVVFGLDITELETKRDEINAKKDEANTQIEEVQSELSATMQEVQELTEKIEKYEEEIAGLVEQETDLQANITDLEGKLKVSQESYNNQKDLLEERLILLYESGETSYLDVLLNSKNISDFISNYYLISEIAKYDIELLTDMENEKIKIANNKKEVEEKKETLRTARINKEKTNIVLENTRVIRNNYISQLTEEEKELQEKINIYNQELKKVESDILVLTTAGLTEEYTGGAMAWPVPRVF